MRINVLPMSEQEMDKPFEEFFIENLTWLYMTREKAVRVLYEGYEEHHKALTVDVLGFVGQQEEKFINLSRAEISLAIKSGKLEVYNLAEDELERSHVLQGQKGLGASFDIADAKAKVRDLRCTVAKAKRHELDERIRKIAQAEEEVSTILKDNQERLTGHWLHDPILLYAEKHEAPEDCSEGLHVEWYIHWATGKALPLPERYRRVLGADKPNWYEIKQRDDMTVDEAVSVLCGFAPGAEIVEPVSGEPLPEGTTPKKLRSRMMSAIRTKKLKATEDNYVKLADAVRWYATLEMVDRDMIPCQLWEYLDAPDAAPGSATFPTPKGATWGDLTIRKKDGETISIRFSPKAGGATAIRNYTQMGMARKDNSAPTRQWELLGYFLDSHGIFTWDHPRADRTRQKQKDLLASELVRYFGIDEPPFHILKAGKKRIGWQAKFNVSEEP